MEKLTVELGTHSYDILFKTDFNDLPNAIKEISTTQKLLIVTDTNVEKLYLKQVSDILKNYGYDVAVHSFMAGEENKTMNTILSICSACINHNMDRKSMIVALGGGVVGDMAGFAAAIYMRGIDFVQIPTTLLSQSDSSVGGKTGIDFASSKNILGAFHQPKLVYINVDTLKTLPQKEFISGMGEVIKHGMIRDAKFFEYLQKHSDEVKTLDSNVLLAMTKTNCTIKASVVASDEKEHGLRAILNFGHTIGHAVESAAGFRMTHGQCVGIGMCAVCYLACMRGMIQSSVMTHLEEILCDYGFEIKAQVDREEVYRFLLNDKKKSNGKLKFVLPTSIGSVIIVDDVTKEEIFAAIDYINLEE